MGERNKFSGDKKSWRSKGKFISGSATREYHRKGKVWPLKLMWVCLWVWDEGGGGGE